MEHRFPGPWALQRSRRIGVLLALLALALAGCSTLPAPPPADGNVESAPEATLTPAAEAEVAEVEVAEAEVAEVEAEVETAGTDEAGVQEDEAPAVAFVAEDAPELPFPITLPPGFTIRVFAEDVPNARSMALGEGGTLFVGNRSGGSVYAVLDHDQDYVADEVITLLSGANMPNGVAIRDGDLYVAEVSRIWRFDDIEAGLPEVPEPVLVNDSFPSDQAHGWKFIRFGPDGKLYVPVGAPCNICDIEGSDYGTIKRMNADGSELEVFARGVRNSVGFDWHPDSGELWFTDNGRDQLGDDLPPDELNHAPEQGMHFGYPYCHGGTIPDPQLGAGRSCEEFSPPAQPLGPHVAALGMRFYTGEQFPEAYRNQIFIAEHGSWNRSDPIGYRIMLVRLEGDRVVSYEPFAEGWLRDRQAWGRPVDLQILPDGSLLVSDDAAGAIYRITYSE